MTSQYVEYLPDKITKEVLDSIQVGDLIKVNDWKKPMRVKAVSENYFVMVEKQFGNVYYSVFSKRPFEGAGCNGLIHGLCYCGPDYWTFGSPLSAEFNDLYHFENEQANKLYLEAMESGAAEISMRRGVAVQALYVKKGKKDHEFDGMVEGNGEKE